MYDGLPQAETAKRGVDGYAIEGLSTGETPEQFAKVIDAVLSTVPSSKPRWLQCSCGPEQVLDMVAAGVDLFDGLYPVVMAEMGHALMFSFADCTAPTDGAGSSGSTTQGARPLMKTNLWDSAHCEELVPLKPSCTCVACKHCRMHTFASVAAKNAPVLICAKSCEVPRLV